MKDVDPFGRAIREHHEKRRSEPLVDRDGAATREHAIEEWYFGEHTPGQWRDRWLRGPVLDMGAGAGRDTLYYQESFETVAIEVSEHLVAVLDDRGVEDARVADMFALGETFERDRFGSAHAIGTQLGLAGSLAGVRAFLQELAAVTTPAATAVLDNYAPDRAREHGLFAYRPDPRPGIGWRVFHSLYRGTVGRTLVFCLFSVDRLREATVGTPWTVVETTHRDTQWRAALAKEPDAAPDGPASG